MQIIHDTFTENDITHEAVGLSWDDVSEVLGHGHRGAPEDDAKLVQALLADGAPAWAAKASGAGPLGGVVSPHRARRPDVRGVNGPARFLLRPKIISARNPHITCNERHSPRCETP